MQQRGIVSQAYAVTPRQLVYTIKALDWAERSLNSITLHKYIPFIKWHTPVVQYTALTLYCEVGSAWFRGRIYWNQNT